MPSAEIPHHAGRRGGAGGAAGVEGVGAGRVVAIPLSSCAVAVRCLALTSHALLPGGRRS
eukprot:2644051-Rhodomonas_salina.5